MPGHVTAACPDQVWALDFLVDQTADGRPIKILTVTDEHTREALATPAARRITSDDTVEALERVVERRGSAPAFIRCDNGPELTAEALKDWCRFSGVAVSYIEPGAPWQNPYIESFNGHLRNELLDMESFNTLLEPSSFSRTGGRSTTTTDPINHSATKPRQHSRANGMLNTTPDPHNKWTEKRGQVT